MKALFKVHENDTQKSCINAVLSRGNNEVFRFHVLRTSVSLLNEKFDLLFSAIQFKSFPGVLFRNLWLATLVDMFFYSHILRIFYRTHSNMLLVGEYMFESLRIILTHKKFVFPLTRVHFQDKRENSRNPHS